MINRKAFVTGSRKYGTPKPHSDIDLVVLVSNSDLEKLIDMSAYPDVASYGLCKETYNLRFGKLNLLCCTHQAAYDVWVKGTKQLIKQKPVERADAVKLFSRLRTEAGLDGKGAFDG